jgi:hypothetical protein
MFFSALKGLLLTTGVKVPAYIFRLPHGPPLRHTNGLRIKVYLFFKLNLVCCD